MANPHIAAIRLTESGSFDPHARDTLIVGPSMGTAVRPLFAEMARHLTHRFQIIGIDLPGQGESPAHHGTVTIEELANTVAELVANLRYTGTIRPGSKVYFAGLSISGQVALQLALEHAELFDGIAVLASAPKIDEPENWEERYHLVMESGTEAMVEMSASLWVANGFVETKKLELQKESMINTDDRSYAEMCKALALYDATDRLAEIELPLFIVAGDQDQMCTVDDAQIMSQSVQNGSMVVMENAAHLLPIEHPTQLADLLDQNLN
ncbi:alpha/beta fold hydrolase [Enteractinococcus coprophilus]|uniref:3-oxoadipate enol-lactonase n=1 Tax=Enteractinococcus coprophilus TaxID=1027633 RepID=A0A543AMS4_9MICC|nr:alpha/beta hydrolase [Enteractinococcus coprophilus]TQL73880.1 3-oxoadipate enol-lactonase [Enteractinococcus coprophilus]